MKDTNMETNTENTNWLISCNVSLFDPFLAFSDMDEIDWPQSCYVKEGDIVYIYCTRPQMRIAFMTKVIRVSLAVDSATNKGEKYFKTSASFSRTPRFGYMRLKLIKTSTSKNLSLQKLISKGLHAAPQGPLRLYGVLLDYIKNQF